MLTTRRAALGAIAAAGIAAGGEVAEALTSDLTSDRLARPTGSRNFPNVLLTTHDGRQARFYDDMVRNRIVLINFMYGTMRRHLPRDDR